VFTRTSSHLAIFLLPASAAAHKSSVCFVILA
jgi:hypothetical protein